MKKILLICPAIPDDMPYLKSYLDCLESFNIEYDVIYLRWTNDNKTYPANYYPFNGFMSSVTYNFMRKFYGYYKYSRFVISKLSKKDYTHVITMGIACSVFLSKFLRKNFKGKYIYDIRDYSQVLRFPLLRCLNAKLLCNSYMNVISSNGFKKWLPANIDYIVCHNTTLNKIGEVVNCACTLTYEDKIKILTIGQIRDLRANAYVIESLSNNDDYEIVFAGKGKTLELLHEMVMKQGLSNVKFIGEYIKEEEDAIVERSTLINVCMGSNVTSNYLLSNRLYLAARLKKPLISFDDCFQAEIIKKYNLGLVINREDILSEKLHEYILSFNEDKFSSGCVDFLRMVRDDLIIYNKKLESFIRGN